MELIERITVGEINSGINVFYGKNREVWVRGGGPGPEYEDCSLYDFIRRIAKAHGVEAEPNNEDLDWQMCDMLADGAETEEGLVALLYAAAIQATEMRERLKMIEEVLCGGENAFDIDHLRELVQSDRDGLTVRLLFKVGDKVYETFCGRIVEKQIIAIAFLISKSEGRVCYHAENARHAVTTIDSKDVGETVFPTREEAEAAMAKAKEAAHE